MHSFNDTEIKFSFLKKILKEIKQSLPLFTVISSNLQWVKDLGKSSFNSMDLMSLTVPWRLENENH